MKKLFLISLIGLALFLVGCTKRATTINQNIDRTKNHTTINNNINNNPEVTTTIQASTTENINGIKVHIEAPVTQTVDCGNSDCFEQKFAKCEKATLTASVIGMKVEYYYEIIGPELGKCKMLTRYNKNPNPLWVDKNMTCLYNNSLKFEEANKQVMNGILIGSVICDGELFQILSSMVK